MSNNKHLLGTTMAVFLVMGISLTAFQATKSNGFEAYAQTDSKMSDSKQANAEQLLKDPKFRQQVIDVMKKNHDVTQNIIMAMINDPTLRLQLIGHLTESKDAIQDLAKLFGQNATNMKMGSMDHSGMNMKMDSKTTMKDSMKKDAMKDVPKKDSMKTGSMMNHGSMSMKKDAMKKDTSSVDFSNVKISSVSANSVTVQGTTNQAVNCQVEYWTAKDQKHYLASDTGDMMDMKHTDHNVTIKNLMSNTEYNYKLKVTLDGKTFYSGEQKFTTKSA